MLDSAGESQVQLVTSTRFVAGVTPEGTTRVVIIRADTTFVTTPFQQTYTIRSDQQFFVEASRVDADIADLRMQVFIDTSKEFDEEGALVDAAPFRFVYVFNRFLSPKIEVVL